MFHRKERLLDAYQECRVYNKMGGLTDDVKRDIADSHGVPYHVLAKMIDEEGL